MSVQGQGHADELFAALGEQLAVQDAQIELVVIGGSALLAIGLISRPTRDVDVVGLLTAEGIADPRPLPEPVVVARARVARDFGLPEDWLNTGPADLLDFGLPDGLVGRLDRRDYGPALSIHFASRFDQIHLKLYAMADQGPGRHEADLRALNPTHDELLTAARWTRTHDPSEGFREQLVAALFYLGIQDATLDT